MKKTLVLIAVVALALMGCVAGPNGLVDTPNAAGDLAGFWAGAWHGVIAPITFVISLFSDQVTVYEVHNNGGWYNFGFLVGIICFGGGGGASSSRKWRRRSED